MTTASALSRTPARFEPALGTAELPFGLDEIDLIRPAPTTWRRNWKAFHEFAHFYQFVATSYGAFYRATTAAQLVGVGRFLTLLRESPRRELRLPLLANESASLTILRDSGIVDPLLIELRLLRLLEDRRHVIYGYRAPKPDPADSLVDEERWLFLDVMQELAGLPPATLWGPSRWEPEAKSLLAHFDISDVLESHAHALSTLWMIQAVERFGLPEVVRVEALAEADRLAIGPYGRFLNVTSNSGYALEGQLLHTAATLCDLALNPPGYSVPPNARFIELVDSTWSPTTRLLDLLSLAMDGELPQMDMRTPGWQGGFLREFKEGKHPWRSYFPPHDPPFDNQQEANAIVIGKIDEAVSQAVIPREVGLYLTDGFLTYDHMQSLRSTAGEPLLLAGNSIEDLQRLLEIAGQPTIVVGDGVITRDCKGLEAAGQVESRDRNDHVVLAGLGWLVGLRRLLYESREELEAARDEPLFIPGLGPTLEGVLGWYGMRLEDFDVSAASRAGGAIEALTPPSPEPAEAAEEVLALGIAQREQDRAEDAINTFQQLATYRDTGVAGWACVYLAETLSSEDRLDEAADAFTRAAALLADGFPEKGMYNFANVLRRQDRMSEAMEWYRRAAATEDPELSARVLLNLGMTAGALGLDEDAREAYERVAASGHPEWSPTARYNLGRHFARLGEFEQARALFEQAALEGSEEVSARAQESIGYLPDPPRQGA